VAFPESYGPEAREAVLRRIPMGREGSVEDIARTVVFLAREAPYITGQIIGVDGGRSALL
jgi:pteridine reductase